MINSTMIPKKPLSELPTHEVVNMPPHMVDQDLWQDDKPFREAVLREGAESFAALLSEFGR